MNRDEIAALVHELGFSRVRFARYVPNQPPGGAAYLSMVHGHRTAEMSWMARGIGPRLRPEDLLPGVRSALVVGIDYFWPRPPKPQGLVGRVSRYAWGRDYHNLVSKRLRKLGVRLRAAGVHNYWSVDARPLIERAWAEHSGLGYVGRNCMLIVPGESSFLFLGVVLLAVDVSPDPPLNGGLRQYCGRCTRCHDVCPTSAFVGDGQLDAARCISTLTIEHSDVIPAALAEQMGDWVFGCDDCQEVCPHNHRPPTSLERDFQPVHPFLDLSWLVNTDEADIEAALTGTPLRRPKAWGLKRNAAVVLGNSGCSDALPLLHRLAEDPHPVVAAQAIQARARLTGDG